MKNFKRQSNRKKTNFRLVSVLPLLSKVFEWVIYNQLGKHMDTFLNKLLCGLEKPTLLNMPSLSYCSNGRRNLITLGSGNNTNGTSKAYDCLPHDYIIAKLEVYGLTKSSLSLLLNYLNSRKG